MKINRLRILPLLFLFVVTVACKPDESVYFINSSVVDIKVPQTGGSYNIVIESNAGWDLAIPESWASATVNEAKAGVTPVYIKLSFSANQGEKIRYQDLAFVGKLGKVQTLLVVAQAGTVEGFGADEEDDPNDPPSPAIPDTLCVTPQAISIGGQGGIKKVSLTSNVTWKYVGSSQEWCKVTSVPSATEQEAGEHNISVWVERSDVSTTRDAVLTFLSANDSLCSLQIIQRPIGIYTADDLASYRDSVNAGHKQAGFMDSDSVVQLYADVDLSDYPAWEPIGTYINSTMRSIKGTFNGNNHSIHNMDVKNPSSQAVGLFGYLDNASIENLTIASDCTIQASSNASDSYSLRVGGLVGYVDGGTVDNCHFMGSVTVITSESGLQPYTGGIAGQVEKDSFYQTSAYVTRCSNSGSVQAKSYVGGIVGYLYNAYVDNCENAQSSTVTFESIGAGIIGVGNGATITSCTNYGTVYGQDAIGGICGMQLSASTLQECDNYANISCVPDEDGNADALGGIVGASMDSFVDGCTNNGNIVGVKEVGGIVGDAYGSFAEIENCSNYGTVTGSDAVGGICGNLAEDVDITSCTNSEMGTITSESMGGGICGATAESAASAVISDCTNAADVLAQEYAGGIVAWANCDVESCVNSGKVQTPQTSQESDTVDGDQAIVIDITDVTGCGGIAAVTCADITSSSNTGSITGVYAGGTAAWTYGTTYNKLYSCENSGDVNGVRNSAGIVAMNYAGYQVDTCLNSGVVSGLVYLGGIVGFNNAGTMSRCDNSGGVSGLTGEGASFFFAGGVCGNNYRGKMESCYNKGAVSRADTTGESKYVGGLLGYNVATNGNSATTGVINTSVHSGTVNAYHNEDSFAFVGAICGFFHSGTNDVGEEGGTRSTGTVTRLLSGGTTEVGEAGDMTYYFGGTN